MWKRFLKRDPTLNLRVHESNFKLLNEKLLPEKYPNILPFMLINFNSEHFVSITR